MPRPISTIKPKGPGRGGKRPWIAKEDPKLLGEIVENHHVLGEPVPWKERAIHYPQQPSPSFPNEGTSVGGQLWEHGERAIVKEHVTSALNARIWQSSRINEWMTPEQCHPVYYNSQQAEGSTGREALDGTDTQVATCTSNNWTARMKGA